MEEGKTVSVYEQHQNTGLPVICIAITFPFPVSHFPFHHQHIPLNYPCRGHSVQLQQKMLDRNKAFLAILELLLLILLIYLSIAFKL